MNIGLQQSYLDYLPVWAVYLLTIGLSLLAVELGFLAGRYWKKSHQDEEVQDIGTMLGATLGLWAFLLAFLVSMALTRFDERRVLVLTEANSIGTTYLRTGFLPEPDRGESRKLLLDYARSRIAINREGGFREAAGTAAGYHARLWALAENVAINAPPNPIYASYITSLNETIDLHTARVTALTSGRVPYTIHLGMYIVGTIAMFLLGFQSGISGKRNWIVSLALILVFSTVMLLVIDLDRPWGGFLTVSQQPMIDLIEGLANVK